MIHIFEVPLYSEPSQHFKKFLKDIGNPLDKNHMVMVSYWRNKLTFTSSTLDEEGRKASVVPVRSDFQNDRLIQVEKRISLFASKFNALLSLNRNDTEISIQLICDMSPVYFRKYGTDAVAVIRVVTSCKNLVAELALNSFFLVIDPPSEK